MRYLLYNLQMISLNKIVYSLRAVKQKVLKDYSDKKAKLC